MAAGANAATAAHLSADGNPQPTALANSVLEVSAGQERLTRVMWPPLCRGHPNRWTPVFPALANPQEDTAAVDPGTVSASVALAGTDTVAIGPADLHLTDGAGSGSSLASRDGRTGCVTRRESIR